MRVISILIFLSATAKAYDEKVSCKVSINEKYGETCRLENVNLETMPSLRVELDTKSLKYVYFENSEIESFTEEFLEPLRGIEYLNANDVGLESVDGRSLEVLEELLIFWGGQNELKRLEENAFSRNKKLEMIYLKFNRINFIDPKAFEGLDQLYILDISSNRLRTVGRIFDSLTNLIKLDLSMNLIEKIDRKAFKKLGMLRELNIMKNNLKLLNPTVFDQLISLEFINISFNKSPLEVVSGDLFKHNFHLRQIYLISNKIKAIDSSFLENFKPKLEKLSFRKNSCVDDDVRVISGKIENVEKEKLKLCNENYELEH